MHLSSMNILYGALASLSAAHSVRADSCSDGPFEQSSANLVFGAWGYKPSSGFCHCLWNVGLVVTGIEVWSNPYHITGVQFTYSDGSQGPVQGNTAYGSDKKGDNKDNKNNYRHDILQWGATDKITLMEAATNKDGHALGYLHIEVAGRKLEVGSDKHKAKETINVGSGLFLGASGETNQFPSAWSPRFMGTNDGTATITDIKFDDDLDDVNKKQTGIQQVTLSEVYIMNTNPEGTKGAVQSWSFVGQTSKATSSSLSTTKTNTFGFSASVEVEGRVGLPLIASAKTKATTGISYQYQTATTQATNTSDNQTFSWSHSSGDASSMVQPGHAQHCKATVYQGRYNGDYTSTVAINVNGKTFTFKERGTFNSVSFSTADSGCRDILSKDIPGDAKVADASSADKKRAVRFIA